MKQSTSKALESLAIKMQEMRGELEDAKNAVDDDIIAMRESYEGKSERWQEGDAGTTADEIVTALESAMVEIDGILESLGTASDFITDALNIA